MANGVSGHADPHGREAGRPTHIPVRGWTDIARRVYEEAGRDNLSMIAAGVAFYAFMALFPALGTLVSLYGLLVDPQTVASQMDAMATVLPGEARGIIHDELTRLASASNGALGFGFALGLVLTLWAAASGTKALITATNIAYDEDEKRGFLRLNATALGLTLVLVMVGIIALGLVAGFPAVVGHLPLPSWLQWGLRLLRWPILFGFVVVALAALYRYAPSRDEPRWRWASPGALAAAALWLLGSIAFSVYVSHFGNYNKTYGTLAAVVVLQLWLLITAYAVLIGAEINAESERQTKRDTTRGPEQPMGQRRANAADTLGEIKN
jgi:membrane protein